MVSKIQSRNEFLILESIFDDNDGKIYNLGKCGICRNRAGQGSSVISESEGLKNVGVTSGHFCRRYGYNGLIKL